MSIVRRKDSKGRVLQNGESERKDGLYQFRYTQFGKRKTIYAKTLNDLRKEEKEILKALDENKDYEGGDMTVLELVQKYIDSKTYSIKEGTVRGYSLVINKLQSDPLGKKQINKVSVGDVKNWVKQLYTKQELTFKTITFYKTVLSAAFKMAIEEDLINKNPSVFQLKGVIKDNSEKRRGLTDEEVTDWLNFLQNDPCYSLFLYHLVIVMLGTGLRIGEICGLTIGDLDFSNKRVRVVRQMKHGDQKRHPDGCYIESPKSKAGIRDIPMTDDVYISLKTLCKIAEKTGNPKYTLNGIKGFLLWSTEGYRKPLPLKPSNIEIMFRRAREKFKGMNPDKKIPYISPHVMRHTFCSRLARSNVQVNSLMYLMGHADIKTTLGVYTHTGYDDAKTEIAKAFNLSQEKECVSTPLTTPFTTPLDKTSV